MEKLTSGQSQKFGLKTSEDSPSATSSRELEPGHTHYATLDGQMILPFGQAPVPASLSVQAGSGKASQISVTYGPHGSGSFWSAVLTQSLASRLQAKTGLLGSTLFRLTWKERATPSGRVVPQLAVSGRRTSGRDCTSWRSPQMRDHHPSTLTGNPERQKQIQLAHQAQLASWPTPNAQDSEGGGQAKRAMNPERSNDLLDFAKLTASGPVPNGSGAATESTGQLNPAHSRWLVGLPPEWCDCAVTATHYVRRKPKPS